LIGEKLKEQRAKIKEQRLKIKDQSVYEWWKVEGWKVLGA